MRTLDIAALKINIGRTEAGLARLPKPVPNDYDSLQTYFEAADALLANIAKEGGGSLNLSCDAKRLRLAGITSSSTSAMVLKNWLTAAKRCLTGLDDPE